MAPDRAAWPASRALCLAGCVLGIALGLLLLVGANLGVGPPREPGALEMVGLGVLGLLGVAHVALGALALGSVWAMPTSPRLHGLLLAMWGVVGLFLGFGLWVGSALLVVGGLLAAARGPGPAGPWRRRPAV